VPPSRHEPALPALPTTTQWTDQRGSERDRPLAHAAPWRTEEEVGMDRTEPSRIEERVGSGLVAQGSSQHRRGSGGRGIRAAWDRRRRLANARSGLVRLGTGHGPWRLGCAGSAGRSRDLRGSGHPGSAAGWALSAVARVTSQSSTAVAIERSTSSVEPSASTTSQCAGSAAASSR